MGPQEIQRAQRVQYFIEPSVTVPLSQKVISTGVQDAVQGVLDLKKGLIEQKGTLLQEARIKALEGLKARESQSVNSPKVILTRVAILLMTVAMSIFIITQKAK